MTIAELLETVRRVEVRPNRVAVAASIRACRRAGHLARRKEPLMQPSRLNILEPQHSSAFVPGGRMPPSTSGKDARRYSSEAMSRFPPDSKPIEFDGFGNYGEFAIIKSWMRNRNTLKFIGVWEQIHKPDFKGLEFETFRNQAGLNSFSLTATNLKLLPSAKKN